VRALVTGATGFIGRHLAETLVRRGDEVTVLVRSLRKAVELEPLGVRLVRGDLDDEGALAEAVEGQEIVHHLAGLIRARDEDEFLHVNRDGTRHLVAAAERAGRPRFVLVSSLAAAGPAVPGAPRREGDGPDGPVSAYGRSKLAGETPVRQSELPWTVVRPPVVYGPGDRAVLGIFRIVRWGLVPIFGRGEQELTLVYGPDLAEALARAGDSDATIGRTYYACHPRVVTSLELVRAIGRSLDRRVRVLPLPETLARTVLRLHAATARLVRRASLYGQDKAEEFFQRAWTAHPGALTRDTGWSAAHDLERGLSATAAWYREAGWI
jgi:nucleoside-diphosphate-sugar epimerase